MHDKFYEHKDIKTLELNNYSSYIFIKTKIMLIKILSYSILVSYLLPDS